MAQNDNQKTNRSIFDILRKFFSDATVYYNPSTGKVKVIDVNHLQSFARFETNRLFDTTSSFFDSVRTGGGSYAALRYFTDWIYNQATGHIPRRMLLRDYDAMDLDSILAAALNVYASEVTLKNEQNEVITIISENDKVKELLYNLFYNILNIEFNLRLWVRNMLKYGDTFLKLDLVDKLGIVNAIPMSPYFVSRVENPDNPREFMFIYDTSLGYNQYYQPTGTIVRKEYYNYEIAHFRNLADTNYLPYGRSLLESARKTWYQLVLLEDAMLIYRLTRAPKRYVYYLDVGNIPPNKVTQYIETIVSNTKRTPLIDENTGQYNLRYNVLNILEDLYIPVRGNNTATKVEQLEGLDWDIKDDLTYLRKKMISALSIPPAYLSYEEDINAKATLTNEDIRFAKNVESIQSIIVSELIKLAMIHLYLNGVRNDFLFNFDLKLTPPSNIIEAQKLELLEKKLNIADSMINSGLFDKDYVYKTIFNFSDVEINEMKARIKKQQEEESGGGNTNEIEEIKTTKENNDITDNSNERKLLTDTDDDKLFDVTDAIQQTITDKEDDLLNKLDNDIDNINSDLNKEENIDDILFDENNNNEILYLLKKIKDNLIVNSNSDDKK